MQTETPEHLASRVLDAVSRALNLSARGNEPGLVFEQVLADLLEISGSEAGYVAEMVRSPEGDAVLRTRAGTNLADDSGPVSVEIPIRHGARIVGQFGLAGRAAGYDATLIAAIEPLGAAVAVIIDARRADVALVEAERAVRALGERKREFIADVSHELRTPLTSILSFAELLRDDLTHLPDAPEAVSFAETIDRNARRLRHIVDNVLLADRLESGTFVYDPRPVYPADIVDAAARSLHALADEGAVTVEVERATRTMVHADARAVNLVLVNLITNAINATPAGGNVSVRVGADRELWWFQVADSGIGIAQREQAHLFDRTSTGLGLIISRAIIELHGGTIAINSVEGTGTTVNVSMPRLGTRR